MSHELRELQMEITRCGKCPRLVEHRERVARVRTRRFADETYWGRPVPSFGDPKARLLVVGLAPAAHGANRTGRMFTGDRSGDWLYEVLHEFGFANQAESTHADDGLKLKDCWITAPVHCAPPDNKPTREEKASCMPYLARELELFPRLRVVIALGRIGFDAYLAARKLAGQSVPRPKPGFGHGVRHDLDDGHALIASYHPSQQNTFTGRLTRDMFHAVFRQARKELA